MNHEPSTHGRATPGPVEILSEWEGPAIHEPGVLFEEQKAEHLTFGADVAAFVGWLALVAVSGVIGNATYEATKRKARHILDCWRQHHGKAKVDEIKQRGTEHMKPHQASGKLTGRRIAQRIEALFEGMQAPGAA